jgi:hypothetical protein
MKTKILSVITFSFIILFHTVSEAQSRKQISKAGVRKITEADIRFEDGKEVKTILSQTSYNRDGNETEVKEYERQTGLLKNHEKKTYNSQGDLIKTIECNAEGNEVKHTLYKYNSDGMRILREMYEPPGQLKSKRVYTYEK